MTSNGRLSLNSIEYSKIPTECDRVRCCCWVLVTRKYWQNRSGGVCSFQSNALEDFQGSPPFQVRTLLGHSSANFANFDNLDAKRRDVACVSLKYLYDRISI